MIKWKCISYISVWFFFCLFVFILRTPVTGLRLYECQSEWQEKMEEDRVKWKERQGQLKKIIIQNLLNVVSK